MLLVQTVRIPDEGIELFQRFEATVLPLLPQYGGKLEQRLRSSDASFEVHIVSFPSSEAFEDYLGDPHRQRHLRLLQESRAATELLEVTDVTQERRE